MSSAESRAVPFHCPYCGEEDLFPFDGEGAAARGAWECRACLRAFTVTMIAQLRPPALRSRGPSEDTR